MSPGHEEPAGGSVHRSSGDGPTYSPAPEWIAVTRSRTYELVLERIEEQIVAGNLRVGDRLPAERDLASQLAVSRSSVREAVRILEAQGVVVSSVGKGPDAGTVIAALPAEALTRVLRLHLALSSFELAEMVDARVTLERSSVELAAREATAADLQGLESLLEAMDDPRLSRNRFNELDTDFHVALARASHNRLVSDVTVALRNSLRGRIQHSFGRLSDWEGVRAGLMADHRSIYEAVRAGEPEAAASAVEAHIRGFAAVLLDSEADSSAPDEA